MFGNNVFNKYIAVCSCRCNHKSSCFNLVGNNSVCCTFKIFYSLNLDYICTCSHNICTHRIEEICEVNYMRFFSSIFYDSKTFCLYCCENCIHGCTDSYNVKEYLTAFKLIAFKVNHSLTYCIICTEYRKGFKMLVNRSVAKRTASGHRNSCLVVFSEQSSEKII